jgi:hypothetical protein
MKLSRGDFYPEIEEHLDFRDREPSIIGSVLDALLRVIALVLYGMLELLDGLICPLLSGLSLLFALTALIYEGVKLPHSPFWILMGASFGCALAMVLYYLLMRFLRFVATR